MTTVHSVAYRGQKCPCVSALISDVYVVRDAAETEIDQLFTTRSDLDVGAHQPYHNVRPNLLQPNPWAGLTHVKSLRCRQEAAEVTDRTSHLVAERVERVNCRLWLSDRVVVSGFRSSAMGMGAGNAKQAPTLRSPILASFASFSSST